MIARFRAMIVNTQKWHILEIAIIGLFFWQALRQFIGDVYRQSASASLISAYPPNTLDPTTPGYTDPADFTLRLMLIVIFCFLPILASFIPRWRWSLLLITSLIALPRLALNGLFPLDSLVASSLVVMATLAYIVILIKIRPHLLPYLFILGLALEQLSRATGDTFDPLLRPANAGLLLIIVAFLLISTFFTRPKSHNNPDTSPPASPQPAPYISFWAGIGIGALLFLQLSLLGLPNAIVGRTGGNYTLIVGLLIFATLAPIIPHVRTAARAFVAPFDTTTRGWIWFLLLAFLIILGTRLPRVNITGVGIFTIGSFALVIAQMGVTMLWWYIVKPRPVNQRDWSALWLLLSFFTLALLTIGDNFTYEYAFIRDFPPPLEILNTLLIPLLRGFRGMGLALLLIAILLATMPMIFGTKNIPWQRSTARSTLLAPLAIALAVLGAWLARPPVVTPLIGVNEMRIGTYNIHGGYSELFDYDLQGIGRAILQSGADVLMLQEVDAGRLASYGVDQSLWLARRLGMDRRFYPTIEGLRGLAVLSRAPIVFADGTPLTSLDQQTGLQRVQVLPAEVPITFYNTTLGLLLEGESLQEQERNQRQQLNQILTTIDAHIEQDYGGRVENVLMVLGGTFHNVPDSPLLDILQRTGFSDPFAGSNPDLTATLVRTDRRGRIDYLWIWRQGLRWSGNGVIDNPASDHRLAFVNLIFGG